MFRGGCPSTISHILEGNLAIDVDKVLSLARESVPNNDKRPSTRFKVDQIRIESGKPDKRMVDYINETLPTIDDENSCTKYFRMTLKLLGRFCNADLSKVKASLLSIKEYQDWLMRQPHQYLCIDRTILNAYEWILSQSLDRAEIKPLLSKTPIHTVITSGRKLSKAYKAKIALLPQVPTAMTTESYKLLQFAIENSGYNHNIVTVPCGMAKSLGSAAYVSAFASSKNRYWIVKDTIQSAIECRSLLYDLGMGKADIGLIAGYDSYRCQSHKNEWYLHKLSKALPNCEWKTMYSRDSSPCLQCPVLQNCAFGTVFKHSKSEWEKPIVVLSHEKFLRMAECGKIPESVTLIIDESPSVFESYELTHEDWNILFEILDGTMFSGTHYLRAIRACCKGGTAVNPFRSLSPELIDYLTRYSHSCKDEHTSEIIAKYVHFFRHDQYRQVMLNRTNHSLVFCRDRVSFSLKNKMVILDASAELSCVEWDGYRILKSEEHKKVSYDNVTLYPCFGNPTLSHINRKSSEYFETVKKHIGDSSIVFLASNKSETQKDNLKIEIEEFVKWAENQGKEVIQGVRGTDTRGSNKGRSSDVVVIAMSLFTSVHDYSLRASISSKKTIDSDSIWTSHNGITYPSISSKGFKNPLLNEISMRSYCDEIYQTIMRSRARNHMGERVSAIAMIPSIECLLELRRIMPGLQIEGDSDIVISLKELDSMSTEELQKLSDNRISELLKGSKRDTLQKLETIETIIAYRLFDSVRGSLRVICI